MATHTNRGKRFNPCRAPSPKGVRMVREWKGDTQEAAAARICAALRSWQQWEADEGTADHRRMHPAFWRLYLLEVGLDPDRALITQLLPKR